MAAISPEILGRRGCEKLTYTILEAAAATGIGRSSLYKAIGEGRLFSIKVAGRRLIPAHSLKAFLSLI